jgi:hypothetical protein
MYVYVRNEQSCLCILGVRSHVCVCYGREVMYVYARGEQSCMCMLGVSSHVCVC